MSYMTNRVNRAVGEYRDALKRDPRIVYLSDDAYSLYIEENSPQPGESSGFQPRQQSGVDVRPFSEAVNDQDAQLKFDEQPETDMVVIG